MMGKVCPRFLTQERGEIFGDCVKHSGKERELEPYAPIPVSLAPSDLKIGSWFQHHVKLAQLCAGTGIAAGLVYLTWRFLYTSTGVSWWSFTPLFLAEVFGYFTYLIFVLEAWNLPKTPRLPPLILSTDIVIPSYNESREIVEPTIIGALEVRGQTTIWLLDDGRRPEMAELAAHYGIQYVTRDNNLHAKAGNINAALPQLTGELLLIVDADHVPAPDFLEATTGYFSDPKVGLVQTAHSFRNHNSVAHSGQGRNEQSLFFDVLLPGRNRTQSVLWCGSAALIRRTALIEVGGLSTYSIVEDFETSLHMRIAGYKVLYHNEHLVQGLAPDNLNAYVIQKHRWAQGLFMLYRPSVHLPLRKELGFIERISYIGGFLYYITPYQKLLYEINLVGVAIFGLVPVGYTGGWYLTFWALATVLNLIAVTALERGTSQPFEGLANTFITMEAYLRASLSLFSSKPHKFVVTPKSEVDLGGWEAVKILRLPIALAIINVIAIIYAWFNQYSFHILNNMNTHHLSIPTTVVITLFGGTEVYVISKTSIRIYNRQQLRELWRFPVRLRAFVDDELSSCIDLHQNGAAILTTESILGEKSSVKVKIECRDVDGKTHWVHGVAEIRSRRKIAGNEGNIRIGCRIIWDNATSRAHVIRHCYVVEQYLARQRFWLRTEDRFVVLLPASINQINGSCVDISEHGASFVVQTDETQLTQKGDVLDVLVGDGIKGRAEVRNIINRGDGDIRIGCTVQWEESDWIHAIERANEKFNLKRRKSASVINPALVS